MLTKGAIGNLVNRYRAVLKKCNLINTFGSLAVASMLVLGGAGVGGAAELGDENTYTTPITGETELLGNGNTVLNIIGQEFSLNSNPLLVASNGLTSIKNIKELVFSGTFGIGGDDTGGANASLASNGKTINFTNINTIKDNNIAINTNLFHALGGNYNFTNIGKIDIQSGGITFMAQPQGGRNANIDVSADEINIKTNAAVAQASSYNNLGGSSSITLTAKNITLESGEDKACVTVFNKFNGTITPNKGNITITATENLSITGSTAVNAQYGKDADNTAKINLTANNITITNNGQSYLYSVRARDYAEINLNAANKASLSGDIAILGNSSVTLAAGGTTTITGDVSVDDTSSLTLNLGGASTIDGALDAEGSVAVSLNSGDASLTVDSSTGDGTISVSGSGAANDAVAGDKNALMAKVKDADGNTIATTFTGMEEGLISGAVDANGNQKVNTVMQDTLDLATAAPLAVGRIVMNDVRKRMGDLRSAPGEAGVWMRWDGGKLKGDAGLTNDFNTIQVGGDHKVGKNCRFGVAAAFTHGDLDHSNGNGEMETYSFSAYSTWMGDNGMFADVIARVGFTKSEISMKGQTIDLDNEALSLSAEYGWRFDLCKQFYVEPQVELTYTYLTEADSEVSYATYKTDSVDSLIGRAGLAAGWKLPNEMGDIYARASVVQEFLGDTRITGSAFGRSVPHSLDGQDTWLEYGIGANIKLTDKTYIWADVERTEGADIDEEWRGTVGIRFSF